MLGGNPEDNSLETFVSEKLYDENSLMTILKILTENYIVFTAKEVEKWQQDSLDFFLNQKEESNEVSGNFLRNKSKQLIAAISLRFG